MARLAALAGPLAVVSLIFTPGLAGHLLTLLRTQAIRKVQREPESIVSGTQGQPRRGCAFSLHLVLLMLAVLPQFLVIINAGAFDTSGPLSLTDVVIVSRQEAWASGFFDYNVGGYAVLWHYSAGRWTQVNGSDVSGLTASPDGEAWGVGGARWLEHEDRGN